jgi:hypothetical protein
MPRRVHEYEIFANVKKRDVTAGPTRDDNNKQKTPIGCILPAVETSIARAGALHCTGSTADENIESGEEPRCRSRPG